MDNPDLGSAEKSPFPTKSAAPSVPPHIPGHRLHRRIGAGSYGEVWLAQNDLEEWRAVKIVRWDKFDDDVPYEREFKGISNYAPVSLQHPSLLPVLQVGRNDEAGYFYCVMELADDAVGTPIIDAATYVPKTLSHVLRTRLRLPLDECLSIGLKLATALEVLHERGLVHRDVKPSNIIFLRNEAKLADIGLVAKYENTLSQVGADGYLPQHGAGKPQADLFALGKVLYETSTGLDRLDCPRLPDLSRLPSHERKGILEINSVILKACHESPARRYRNAAELKTDLVLIQEGFSLRLRRRLKMALFGLGALAVLLFAALIVQQVWNASREKAIRREVLIREAQQRRVSLRQSGWFSNNWLRLNQAFDIRSDLDVVEQAASTLAGLDVSLLAGFRNIGGSSLMFDASGQMLVGGLSNGPAHFWSPKTPDRLEVLTEAGDGPARFVIDGGALQFAPLEPGRFALRDARTGQVRREFTVAGDAAAGTDGHPALALSPDGSRVAAAVKLDGTNGVFVVWNAATGEELGRGTEVVTALAFSPDGSFLATGDEEGVVVVRSLPELSEIARVSGGRLGIRSLAFAPNLLVPYQVKAWNWPGRFPWLLAAGDGGGVITIWDVATKKERTRCRGSHYDVFAIAFNPDGTLLASAGRNEVRLWDAATEQPVLSIASPGVFSLNYVRAVAFSHGGDRLAAVGESHFTASSLVVFDVNGGHGIATLRGLRAQVSRVWWASDGKRVAGLAHDWTLGVWEVPSGQLIRVFEVPKGGSADNAAVAFFPDNQRLAYASGTEARIYDVDNGALLKSLRLESGLADHLRFVDEDRLLLLRKEAHSGQRKLPMWRIRNLLGSAAGGILFEQQDTDWWAYNMALPAKGDRFFVWNRKGMNGEKTSTIRAYDLHDGQERWRKATQALEADVVCDPIGEFGAFQPSEKPHHALFRFSDGELVPGLNQHHVHATYSGRRRFATGAHAGGGCLFFAPELPPEGVRLAMDWRMVFQSEFSPDGSRLAWGTEEGLVLVADLDEVLRRLSRFRTTGP